MEYEFNEEELFLINKVIAGLKPTASGSRVYFSEVALNIVEMSKLELLKYRIDSLWRKSSNPRIQPISARAHTSAAFGPCSTEGCTICKISERSS